MTVRAVIEADMPLLEGWAKKRGCVLNAALVSPHGFLAELDGKPLMCAWGAMILDTPFLEVDHVYCSPRVTKKTGLAAWAALVSALRAWAHEINAGGGQQVKALKLAMNADMAPYAEQTGGEVGSMTKLTCIYQMEVHHGT